MPWATPLAYYVALCRRSRDTRAAAGRLGPRSIRRIKTTSRSCGSRSNGYASPTPRSLLKKNPPACWAGDSVADSSGSCTFEIVTERLKREFNLSLIVTIPTISYVVTRANGSREIIYTPAKFPEHGDIIKIEEPWAKVIIITPPSVVSTLIQLLHEHEANTLATETYQDGRIEMVVEMPLRELMRGFFDKLKNISSGYASLSYEILSERPADVVRLDVLVAEEPVPAFARRGE